MPTAPRLETPPGERLAGRTVAVLGFGNQGSAQALNLRDSGVAVVVGARPDGAGAARARAHGFEVRALADAARGAEWAALLLPDEAMPALWPELRPALAHAAALVFAHGYVLLYAG